MAKRALTRYLEQKPLPTRPMPLIADGERVLKSIGQPGYAGDVDPSSLTQEERRSAVAILLGAGWSREALAKRFKVSVRMMTKDIEAVRLMASQECVGTTIREVAGQLQLRLDYQYKRTMEILDGTTDPNVMIRAVKLAIEVTKAQLEVWKKLGFQITEADDRRINREVSARVMVKVQQMMVVVEEHVDEARRAELAHGWKQVLSDIPLQQIDGEVL